MTRSSIEEDEVNIRGNTSSRTIENSPERENDDAMTPATQRFLYATHLTSSFFGCDGEDLIGNVIDAVSNSPALFNPPLGGFWGA